MMSFAMLVNNPQVVQCLQHSYCHCDPHARQAERANWVSTTEGWVQTAYDLKTQLQSSEDANNRYTSHHQNTACGLSTAEVVSQL